MFEDFNVPAVYLANQAVLSLAATGRKTGLVMDIGYAQSVAVPVQEGQAIRSATMKTNFGGYHLTDYLSKILTGELHDLNDFLVAFTSCQCLVCQRRSSRIWILIM
jgi:actin-related protein